MSFQVNPRISLNIYSGGGLYMAAAQQKGTTSLVRTLKSWLIIATLVIIPSLLLLVLLGQNIQADVLL